MAGWLLWGKHAWDGLALVSSFFGNLTWTLWEGLSLFTLYLGLEPFVRRRWPDSLISWSRLLAGSSATRSSAGTCSGDAPLESWSCSWIWVSV